MNQIMNYIPMIKLEKYFIIVKSSNWLRHSMKNLWMGNQCLKKIKLDKQL